MATRNPEFPKWVKKCCLLFCCFFQGPFRNTNKPKKGKTYGGTICGTWGREHAQTRCKVDGVWRFHHLTTDSKIISFIVSQCSARHRETCENDAHNVNAKSHGLGFFVGPKGVTAKMGYDNSWYTFPICFFPVSFFGRRKKAWKTRQKNQHLNKKTWTAKGKPTESHFSGPSCERHEMFQQTTDGFFALEPIDRFLQIVIVLDLTSGKHNEDIQVAKLHMSCPIWILFTYLDWISNIQVNWLNWSINKLPKRPSNRNHSKPPKNCDD